MQSRAQSATPAPRCCATYGIGAQILKDLGVKRMRVLSAPKQLQGLAAFDLEVTELRGRHESDAELILLYPPWRGNRVPNDQPKSYRRRTAGARPALRDRRGALQRLRGRTADPRRARCVASAMACADKQIEIVRVPGAFDMPLVARKLRCRQPLRCASSRSAR